MISRRTTSGTSTARNSIGNKRPMRYFFLLILLLPVVAQVYVSWRMWQLMPLPVWARLLVVILMAAAFGLFFYAMMPRLDRLPLPLASAVYQVGTSWLIIVCYLLMLWVVLDVLRVCHIVPAYLLRNSWTGTALVVGLMAVVFTYGYFHYINKVRVRVDLSTDKSLAAMPTDEQGQVRPLRIVMTSDWHLGYHNRKRALAHWIDLINAEQPDVILIAGDIIDHSFRPLEEEQMAAEFHRLTAPVYACLGNHEYISGASGALQFYDEAGIRLLRDEVVEEGPLMIVGRDDRVNHHRASLQDLTERLPADKYTIVLDHQPYRLEEAEQAGVDFMLAGHTHHGQVWPLSWITDALYECAYGRYQRGHTHYYISSGLGIWGGKFRIGTRSEYIVAELKEN